MAFWADWIQTPHETRTRTPDGRDLVFLTGTAVRHWRGTGSAWIRDELWIPIGPFWRRIDSVAPIAALGAIANDGQAIDAGWATDGTRWANFNGRIVLIVNVAVRDSDGWLFRASYQATALGII